MYNNNLGNVTENCYTIRIDGQMKKMDNICSKKYTGPKFTKGILTEYGRLNGIPYLDTIH
jgi:hypothetical protein